MLDPALQSWLHTRLFEQVPCNIAVIDRDYRVVEHNRNFEQLFGPGRGRPCHEVYKRKPEPCEQCIAAQTFADGQVRVNDEVGTDSRGRPAHYLVHMFPIIRDNGEIPYIIEMSTDITEVKRLQREYQTLFEKVPCYIAVLNREMRVVRANALMRRTFGATTGQHCWELFKHRDEQCENCPSEMSFADGGTHTSDQVGINRAGEETHYVVTTAPLLGGGQVSHVIEMAVDVTRLRQVEQEKLEAERLAAVGQTVAALAHGIKNILTGLEGGVYIFKSGLERDNRERINQGWEVLNRNIEKVSALARNLLAFSKGGAARTRSVNPADFVQEVVDLYRETALAHHIELKAECDRNMAPAAMDPEGIHTCLANLVSNALDACQASDRPVGEIRIRCREDNECIVFEVEDDGCGIDYEVRRKVFTSFYTTKGQGGTGLGLLLTRKITQEHGGKVILESTPGEGSLFKLVFPRSRLPRVTVETAAGGET